MNKKIFSLCLLLFAFLLSCSFFFSCFGINSYQKNLLDEMLAEPNTRTARFGELLRTHGAIYSQDVDYLSKKTKSSSQSTRRNATRLIEIARPSSLSVPILRKLVKETNDPVVFGIALEGLMREPDIKSLAAARPELLRAAMKSEEIIAVESSLRAAWMIQLSGIDEEFERLLKSDQTEIHIVIIKILADSESKPGKFEPILKEILLRKPNPSTYFPYVYLYAVLSRSEDPSMAELFKKTIDCSDSSDKAKDRRSGFINGIGGVYRPWIYELLFDLVKSKNCWRWQAFSRLEEWKPESPRVDLVKICLSELEKNLPLKRTKEWLARDELWHCNKYMGTLANVPNGVFRPDQQYEELDFAREWLRTHEK